MANNNSRRTFLKAGAIGVTGITIVPVLVMGKSTGQTGRVSPSDKLNIAAVGIGGMGRGNINASVAYWYQDNASSLPKSFTKEERQPKPIIGATDIHLWRNSWRIDRGKKTTLWGNEK